jgi:AcrR family transcriptional regulator
MLDMAAEDGIDRVTTRALARRLGVTEPALYRHFPGGKAEMWRTLAATVGERMQAAWHRALEASEDAPLERLRALIHAQLHTVAITPALPGILFSRTLHRDNADLRAGVSEVGARFHAHIEQVVLEGRRTGELRGDLDARDTAWLLISIVQGTAIRWSLSDHAFDLEIEGARVLDTALAGLVRREADPGGA